MDTRRAREYLNKYRQALADIERTNLLIDKLSAALEAQGIDTTKEKIRFSNIDDRMADLAIELIDAKEKLYAALDYAASQAIEVSETIGKISNPKQREVLHLRYIAGAKWDDIAREVHHDRSWVFRLHDHALEEVELLLRKGNRHGD